MKFVRPIYRTLYQHSRQLAVDTFVEHYTIYHPIATKMLATDLGLELAKDENGRVVVKDKEKRKEEIVVVDEKEKIVVVDEKEKIAVVDEKKKEKIAVVDEKEKKEIVVVDGKEKEKNYRGLLYVTLGVS